MPLEGLCLVGGANSSFYLAFGGGVGETWETRLNDSVERAGPDYDDDE
jgi:hypothetical protein